MEIVAAIAKAVEGASIPLPSSLLPFLTIPFGAVPVFQDAVPYESDVLARDADIDVGDFVAPALVEPGIDGRKMALADHPRARTGKLIVADDGRQWIVAEARVAEYGEPPVPAIPIEFDRRRYGLGRHPREQRSGQVVTVYDVALHCLRIALV